MIEKDERPEICIITNLYPGPLEPSRGIFNKQQFDRLNIIYNVTLYVPVAWPDWIKNRSSFISSSNTQLIYFPQFYTPKIGRSFYGLWMVLSVYLAWLGKGQRKSFKLILGSWAYPDSIGAYALARLLKVPFVMKVHGTDINEYANFAARRLQIAYVAKRSAGIICVSEALSKELIQLGVDPKIPETIYNGVDFDMFSSDPESKRNKTILYVGNLKESKGVLDLARAFLAIKDEEKDLKLVIAGSGPAENELHRLLSDCKDRVVFAGSISHRQVPRLMNQACLLVLPSHNEGVPNVLLESMACGTPVIATRVGGIPEVVEEGVTGLLFEPGDITKLSHALKNGLTINWDRIRIKSHASKYSWEKNIDAVSRLLNQALNSKDGSTK